MSQVLFTLDETKAKIAAGEKLLLAGDEQLLRQLPSGNWIGGTIPYFMGEQGGQFTLEKIFVTQLPDYVAGTSIKVYDEANLSDIYTDIAAHGFAVIILPATSRVHLSFALNAPNYPEFATRPLIGWISGVRLSDLEKVTPKVFNGKTAEALEDAAIVMHVTLPANKVAELGIINIFEQNQGDILTFPESGFHASEVFVNGESQNFADYLASRQADTKLPLVADYYGARVNTSFQSVDMENKQIQFYAPVFQGFSYQLARPVENYIEAFSAKLPKTFDGQVVFSCNCILNYLYSELEGKKTGAITGPITFGEVAYQLLNQTLVYLYICDI